MKQCPFCFKIASDETQFCRSCGRDLTSTPSISTEKIHTTKKYDDNWENDWDAPAEKNRKKSNQDVTFDYAHFPMWVGILFFLSFFIRPTLEYDLLFKEQYFKFETIAIPLFGIFLVIIDLLLSQIFIRNIISFIAMSIAIYISPPSVKYWKGLIEFSFGVEFSFHLTLFIIAVTLLFTLFLFTSRKGTLFASVTVVIFLLFFYFIPNINVDSVFSIMRNRDEFFIIVVKLLPLIIITPAFFVLKIRVFLYLISFGAVLWLFGLFYFVETEGVQSIIFLKNFLVFIGLIELTGYYIYSTLKI